MQPHGRVNAEEGENEYKARYFNPSEQACDTSEHRINEHLHLHAHQNGT